MTDTNTAPEDEAAQEAPVTEQADTPAAEPVIETGVVEVPQAAEPETTTEPTPEPEPVPAPVYSVPANPALLEWPRDEWGFCTDLKSALTQAARNIRGNADKRDVFLNIVTMGVKHALARFEGDAEAIKLEIDREAERIARMNATNRVAGYTPVEAPVSE